MLAADPHAFRITRDMVGQNQFIGGQVDPVLAHVQHTRLCRKLGCKVLLLREDLPDVVFLANAGLVLPRLPEKVIVMSRMKYPSRQKETEPLSNAFRMRGYITAAFPTSAVFEGQGEALWFHGGHLLVVGYGFRASARTVTLLRRVLGHIYRSYGVVAPRVVGVPLETPRFYHLNVAMQSCTNPHFQKHRFVDCANASN